jgi:2-methylisocitrate lyase-like PEP mutase family enzyme
MTTSQREKAELFRNLHIGGEVLVLPNAWDVASARIVEEAGAAAVATTSAGVAWSLGAPDGDQLSRDRALDLVARIAEAVRAPVTADIESGFGADAQGVAETIEGVIAAGAVGVNLEDSVLTAGPRLRPSQEQAERIAAARQAADATGIPLFLNARVDTYLFEIGDPDGRLGETLERAAAYVAAGADGIFIPGVTDLDLIGELAGATSTPLNVMAGPGSPTVGELAQRGVARVSIGPAIARVAYAVARRAAEEVLTAGTYDSLAGGLDFGELNRLLAARKAGRPEGP